MLDLNMVLGIGVGALFKCGCVTVHVGGAFELADGEVLSIGGLGGGTGVVTV